MRWGDVGQCVATVCVCVWLRLVVSDNHQISPLPPEAKQIEWWHCHLRVGCMQAALSHRPVQDLNKKKIYSDHERSKGFKKKKRPVFIKHL